MDLIKVDQYIKHYICYNTSLMQHINSEKIERILSEAQCAGQDRVRAIIEKSKKLQRLTLKEAAVLLAVEDPLLIREIFEQAAFVKQQIYGRRVVLFAPLYISNICANSCEYCAFRSDNTLIKRKALTPAETSEQTAFLLHQGHKRILLVAGEAPPVGQKLIDYYISAVQAIYAANVGPHKIKRVNINCAPLSIEEFKQLKKSGIGTYQIFQETYHDRTYHAVHLHGPKSDPDNRLDAVDRAFQAGIDDVGIGVLYGLYDYKYETLALLSHIEHLEQRFGVGPHTISVPRIEPALGSAFSEHPPYRVSDQEFKKVVAVLRLAVPYTGIILSTRESPELRDELVNLGVSQISAGSNTSPGGYSSAEDNGQFSVHDTRSLDEVIASLIEQGHIPSFCAACYRMARTGEAFMNLARPGTIKGKCSMNALVTLKEYLDDFASTKVKNEGGRLITELKAGLEPGEQEQLEKFYGRVAQGIRDEYV
jgi:2-iminoacetate synthase